jgi:hypothetical protein
MIQGKKMKKIINILLPISLLFLTSFLYAVDTKDTTKKTVETSAKDEEKETPAPAASTPAFNSARLIHVPSTTPVEKKTFDFRINHRFGNAKNTTGDLIGMDSSANTELSLDYGITDKWSVGLSRIKDNKTYESRTKYTFLTQSDKMPVSIAFTGAIGLDTQKSVSSSGMYTASFGPYITLPPTGNSALDTVMSNQVNNYQLTQADRTNYFAGFLISRKFGERVSLQVSPLFVHKNYAKSNLGNDRVGLSFGGSIKLTDDISFIFEGIATKHRDYQGTNYRTVDQNTFGWDTKTQLTSDAINTTGCNNKPCNFASGADVAYMYGRNILYDKKVPHNYVPISLGISYDTQGGHVFQVFVTNMKSLAFTHILEGADYNYLNKDWTVGFNINRAFSL